mgnify:CR=1 FL=1|jgi:hypothetical protein
MIDLLKTKPNLICESETVFDWLEGKLLVTGSLLSFLDALEVHDIPYFVVLNLEGIVSPPTFLTVTLQNPLACSKRTNLNLATYYRSLESQEESLDLFNTLRSYVPLMEVLYTYNKRKPNLVINYTEILQGVVTMSYYDFSVRLTHDSKFGLTDVFVSTYSDTANYFELKTQGAQGSPLVVQLSVDEQTELTLTSKNNYVRLSLLTETLDSMFSDLAQYKETGLKID